MAQRRARVLVLGEAAQADFADVLRTLHERLASEPPGIVPGVPHAVELARAGEWFPDLVVVLQSWPDQYGASAVRTLLALWPVARTVCVYGPWCDSDGRTRTTWPLALRSSASCAAGRIARELSLIESDVPLGQRAMALPLTASRSEIFEADFDGREAPPLAGRRVMVLSPDREWQKMLVRAFERAGASADEPGKTGPPDAIAIDLDPWSGAQALVLGNLLRSYPCARRIGCLGFPRAELTSQALAAGAHAVWFKLAPLTDLFTRL
jgi:hypothetical protein